MIQNILFVKKTKAEICNIFEHFDLAFFEYTSVLSQILTNLIQSKNQIKAIL